MARALWKGSLSFGLVNVPIKVVTAVRPQSVKFTQLRGSDGSRIKQKRIAVNDETEVAYEEIVKGYEVGPDQYVIMRDEDFAAIEAEKSETIDIQDFISLDEIDPVYFDKTYYLVPDKGGSKAYALLLDALRKTNRVAIARFVMHNKEHLVAVRALGDGLSMSTLFFHDEIVSQDTLEEIPVDVNAPEREVKMAEQLIDALTTTFEPDKYEDEYRLRVLSLIESKAEGKEITMPAPREPLAPIDLASALEASLAAAKRRRSEEAES